MIILETERLILRTLETDDLDSVMTFWGDAELMYHFAKPYWEKGYATEAAKACIQYAENHLGLVRIGASIDPENQASRHVLEKVGFQSVGMKWCEATQQYEPYFEITI